MVAGLLALGLPAPVQASVSAKIASFPYTQNWSGLTSTSTWANFDGVEGFLTGTSIVAGNPANTTDAGTLTAEGTLATSLAPATNTAVPNTYSSGAVANFYNVPTDSKTVALSAIF